MSKIRDTVFLVSFLYGSHYLGYLLNSLMEGDSRCRFESIVDFQ